MQHIKAAAQNGFRSVNCSDFGQLMFADCQKQIINVRSKQLALSLPHKWLVSTETKGESSDMSMSWTRGLCSLVSASVDNDKLKFLRPAVLSGIMQCLKLTVTGGGSVGKCMRQIKPAHLAFVRTIITHTYLLILMRCQLSPLRRRSAFGFFITHYLHPSNPQIRLMVKLTGAESK